MGKIILEKETSAVYPKFIKNEPMGEDLFEGKSHERIADAIIKQIKTNYIKIIGLEGNWGSGKSNVIEIIKNKTKDERFLFFLYNVWLHQEDLHRRIIPIELYQHLVKEPASVENSKRENLERKLNGILGNSTETVVTKRPRFSFGVFLVLLIFFLSSVSPSLAALLIEKCKIDIIGYILILLLPVFFSIISFFGFLIYEFFQNDDRNTDHKKNYLMFLAQLGQNSLLSIRTKKPIIHIQLTQKKKILHWKISTHLFLRYRMRSKRKN